MPPKGGAAAARSGSEAPLVAGSSAPSMSTGAPAGGFASSSTTPVGLASSVPSVYPRDSIRDVADQLGLTLRDNVASALASDVEYRLREVLQDASKYMRHAKRAQLRTSDIDAALRAKNIEPLYGYVLSSTGRSSLQSRAAASGPAFRRVVTPSGPIYHIEDEEIDFDKLLATGPIPTLGKGVGWAAHWLAVEGVQPAVPQNPSAHDLSLVNGGTDADAAGVGAGAGVLNGSKDSTFLVAGGAAVLPRTPITPSAAAAVAAVGSAGGANTVVKPLIKHVLPRELQLYYERITTAILTPPASADVPDVPNSAGADADADADADGEADLSAMSVDGLPKKTGTLSVQPSDSSTLHAYSTKSTGNAVRDAALASLRGDPGLHQLVPYLVQWVGERISYSLLDEQMLRQMLLVAHALVVNPHLHIDPYVSRRSW